MHRPLRLITALRLSANYGNLHVVRRFITGEYIFSTKQKCLVNLLKQPGVYHLLRGLSDIVSHGVHEL